MTIKSLNDEEWDRIFSWLERFRDTAPPVARAGLDELPESLRNAARIALELGPAAPDHDSGLAGTRIGTHLEIRRHLCDGGSASVYQGVHRTEEREGALPVAIKLLRIPEREAQRAALKECWDREQRWLRELAGTAGIAAFVEAGEHTATDGTRYLYIATEYRSGLGLRQWAAQPSLTLEDRLDLFAQTCDCVSRLHAHGLVHGDLKPENLHVEVRGGAARVWLLDLGLTWIIGRAWPAQDGMLGTPGYMSPEQVTGEPVRESADIFALGVILLELMDGRRWLALERIPSPEELLLRMREALPARSVHVAPQAVRDRLSQVLAQATAWKAHERPTHVALLRRAVEAAVHDRDERIPTTDASPYRGLLTFDEEHAHLFFGRERESELLLEKLRTRSAVTLIGASGRASHR